MKFLNKTLISLLILTDLTHTDYIGNFHADVATFVIRNYSVCTVGLSLSSRFSLVFDWNSIHNYVSYIQHDLMTYFQIHE